MDSSPTKNADLQSIQLTPVRFLDSPKIRSSSSDSNYNASKSRLEIISKTLQDNYAKWQLAQSRGLSLCNSIEAIKTRCLQKSDKPEIATNTLYPNEMKVYCDKLAIIASIFNDITKNTIELLRQLRSLSKLPDISNKIFYRSWQMTHFVCFVEQLKDRYVKEAEVKQRVTQDLPHCTTRVDLIRSNSAWEYPQFVEEHVALMFAFLAEEINLNK